MIETGSESKIITSMKTAFLLLALACTALAAPTEEDALHEFKRGNWQFTADLYKEISKDVTGNMAVSPFSASTILALTSEGARGESAAEMVAGLSLPSTPEKTRQAFKSFLPKLTSSHEDLKLTTANKIFVGESVKLENDFKQVAVDVYQSGVENVDFAKSIETAKNINEWVEERTANRIKDLIDPKSIDGRTKMVLVNTLYFKGKWTSPFEKFATQKKKFHQSKDSSVDVDMMQQTEYLRYYENTDLNAKFLELSYLPWGGNVSMVLVLPNEKDGLHALEQNTRDLFAPQPFKTERVEVQIPKFRIETKIQMVPILEELGIKKIFSESEADLSGLSSTDKNLFISQVVQKVFIDVNEAGTEAAAATAVSVYPASLPPPPTGHFIADHPFTFYIQSNGVILFTGRYAN